MSATLARRAPEVAVIVPTFNRRESLLRLLRSLDRQSLETERFEIVIVDNNSSDGTAAAVAAFAKSSRARVRCLEERAQGAAHARNRGIRETTAPVIASTDDDVEVDREWLAETARALDGQAAAVVGGRTFAVWSEPLPEWWRPDYERVFLKDLGTEPRPIAPPDYFYTHNLVVRREALERAGLFDPLLAPTGTRHYVGEDVELCRRIHENGGLLYYEPRAIVRHHVEAHRLTRAFFRRRYWFRGMSHAMRNATRGRPLELPYQMKQLLLSAAGWLRAGDPAARFERELAVWRSLGYTARGVELGVTRWRRPVGGGGP